MRNRITLPQKPIALLLFAFAGVAAALPLHADKDPTTDYDKAVGTVVLTNGTGDGQVAVEVDGYGSFGTSVETSSGAFYNPPGALGIGQTSFESALFFADLVDRVGVTEFHDFLTTDDFGADLAHIDVQTSGATQATSSFVVSQYSVALNQTLENWPASGGSRLVQTYTITNNTGQPGTLTLVRFLDGDLCWSGDCNNVNAPDWQNDYAGASEDFRTLYAFDSGDSVTAPVKAISVERSANLTPTSSAYSIQPFRTEDGAQTRMTDRIDNSNGIPATLHNKIYKDVSPQDRLTDSAYDPTLSLQDTFAIPAGGSLVYTTITTWGEVEIGTIVPAIFFDGFESGNASNWTAICNGSC